MSGWCPGVTRSRAHRSALEPTEQVEAAAQIDATAELEAAAELEADADTGADAGDEADTADAAHTDRASESRLPKVGTVLEKRDRYGNLRCKATIEAEGVWYNRKLYNTVSGAAMAAATDLGLKNKTQNGFVFWGITKPTRPAADRKEAASRAWDRYYGHVNALVKDDSHGSDGAEALAMLRKHEQAIKVLRERVA